MDYVIRGNLVYTDPTKPFGGVMTLEAFQELIKLKSLEIIDPLENDSNISLSLPRICPFNRHEFKYI